MKTLVLSVAMLAAGVASAHEHGGRGGGGFRGGGEFHTSRGSGWQGGGWRGSFRAPPPVYVAPRPVYRPPPRPLYAPSYAYRFAPAYRPRVVVAAPVVLPRVPSIGFVASLPFGAVTVMLGSQPYYFGGGSFYVASGSGYSLVDAPFGAVVSQLPAGAQQQVVNGYTYANFGDAWFVWDGNQGAWVVAQCPY